MGRDLWALFGWSEPAGLSTELVMVLSDAAVLAARLSDHKGSSEAGRAAAVAVWAQLEGMAPLLRELAAANGAFACGGDGA